MSTDSEIQVNSRAERRLWALYIVVWCAWYVVSFAHYQRGPVYTEETVNGNLTRGILEGLVAPIGYYQYVDITPGPLVYGALLVPAFAVFGSNMLAMKLLAGLFAAGGAFLWTWNVRRAAGVRAGVLMAVWMLVPPTLLDRMFRLAWANHMEAIFWSALVFTLARRAWSAHSRNRDVLVGLVAGFSVFFCLQNVVGVVAMTATWIWRSRKSDYRRLLGTVAPAFAIGFAPRLWLIATTERFGPVFKPIEVDTPALQKIVKLIFRHVPDMASFSWSWASVIFAVGGFAALGVIAWRGAFAHRDFAVSDERRDIERYLILWAVAYLGAYVFTGYEIFEMVNDPRYTYRYVVPAIPIFMMAMILVASLRPFRYASLALLPLFFAGAWDASARVTWNGLADRLLTGTFAVEYRCARGDDYRVLLGQNLPGYWHAGLGLTPNLTAIAYSEWKRATFPLPYSWMSSAYEMLGRTTGAHASLDRVLEDSAVPETWRAAVLRGAAFQAAVQASHADSAKPFDLDRVGEFTAQWPHAPANADAVFAEGYALGAMAFDFGKLSSENLATEDARRALSERLRRRYAWSESTRRDIVEGAARGFGRSLGELAGYEFDPGLVVKDVFQLPDPDGRFTAAFTAGYNEGEALWALACFRCLYDEKSDALAAAIGPALAERDVHPEKRGDLIALVEGPLHADWRSRANR